MDRGAFVPVRNPRRPNINLDERPIVELGPGRYGTVLSETVGKPGAFTNIPLINDGRVMSSDEAYARWRDTGEHLGTGFPTLEEAIAAAKALSARQGRHYGK